MSDYIATSAAVGSRELSKKTMEHLSPATVRNVLKDLEEMGYLKQPHTSAGRIPTEKGLRFYVDTCVEKKSLSPAEEAAIRKEHQLAEKDIRSLLSKTGKVLATLSQCVSLVVSPKLERTVLKQIEFLPLSQGRLLGIFVSQTGIVENKILEMAEAFNYRELEKINNFCNSRFSGLTLEEAKEKLNKELVQEHLEYDRLLSKALFLSQELFEGTEKTEVRVEGELSILERVNTLLSSIEEKRGIMNILDSCLANPDVRIFIGAESRCETMKDLSLITASYAQDGKLLGTLGVIGPVSMDYSKVISIVDFTAKTVSHLL